MQPHGTGTIAFSPCTTSTTAFMIASEQVSFEKSNPFASPIVAPPGLDHEMIAPVA